MATPPSPLSEAASQPAAEAERDAHLVLARVARIRQLQADLALMELDTRIRQEARATLRARGRVARMVAAVEALVGVAATRASCIDPIAVEARRVYPWWRRVGIALRVLSPWWPTTASSPPRSGATSAASRSPDAQDR